ncbi:uncharacterized protein EV659_101399 [Rhodothalassium salexigens DSM 2132]|uniref:NADH dehydrogenase [ubiquinone] 1 alpha subcomplex assembly factor 3 n=2 Tax=Rhodothalassium salexigens TaxID=1086 RepID=A0A4R2PW78_RHOSA|nr:Mth938-like domain-containing protein [Rhodothalassium salexigens]MBB4210331.1 uncharacterized protein [Rhodothalassium salexigens DSM 2132]TCP38495.1 uncharacterized protein EV659_101399 [Rhodothalassium salexigens DSM 2132]
MASDDPHPPGPQGDNDPAAPRLAMEMKEQARPGLVTVAGYGRGGFRVGQTWYAGAVLVLPGRCVALGAVAPAEIDAARLAPLWDASDPADIVLFGGGASLLPVPAAMRAALAARGLSADPMDSGAAARTFNVLVAEDRRVGAVLLPL